MPESTANTQNFSLQLWQTYLVDKTERWEGSLPQARQLTRRLALGHYENFPVATWLLPKHLRQPFYDVYAYCRLADDLGDELSDPATATAELQRLRAELTAAIAGAATFPITQAVSATIHQFHLEQPLFYDLITAFERDQIQRRYETYADLLEYCRFSANPVGRILLQLTDSFSERSAILSDQVCTGLQLINFWQDIARDRVIDRIYLPQDELRTYRLQESDLDSTSARSELRQLISSLVDRSEQLLLKGQELGRLVAPEIRFDIRLFALGGLLIARKIRQQNYDVLHNRPRLHKTDLPGLFWSAYRDRFLIQKAAIGKMD